MSIHEDQDTARLRESAKLYRLLVDMIPQHVWSTDATGRFIYASRRLTDYTGATVDQLGADGWLDLVHPDDRERSRVDWQKALISGKPASTEFRLRRTDGTYRWFLVQATPLRNENGTVVQWFGTTTDIEEQKALEAEREDLLVRERAARAEAEARAGEERSLRNAVSVAVAAESVKDAVKRIAVAALDATGATGVYATYIDHERDEVVPVVHAGDVPDQIGPVPYNASLTRRVIAQNAPIRLARIDDSAGRDFAAVLPAYYREWSLLVMPLIGTDPIGALFLSRKPGPSSSFSDDDVARVKTFTELVSLTISRVKLFEKAEQRRVEVEQLSESRTRLIRGLGHDLKNPLGAADGFAALLEEGVGGPLTPANRKSVQHIRRSIQSSLRLIEDLLDFARAEKGRLHVSHERVDISALAREVAEDFRAQINGMGLALQIEGAESLVAHTDPGRVRQIIGNMVSNAAKYTHAGRVVVSTHRRSDAAPRVGHWIVVDVRDTGPGIPADKREIIFQEFTRLDPNAPHGAGVGLAISRQIARALGGDITVASVVEKGSTFTLWIPER